MNPSNLINDYLSKSDWRVRENANTAFSLQGLSEYLSTSLVADYWLNQIYPDIISNAHRTAQLHIHDLGKLSAYCCGWDLFDILLRGFGGVSNKLESAPPKHFDTALLQLVNFMYTISGEIAGAVAVSNFDTLLAPFIRSDNLTYQQVKQIMQQFVFNMNVPTRTGFQAPFTNITMDLTVPENLANNAVVVGGKMLDTTYADYQHEMDILNQAFAEVMLEGDAKGRIFSFPIPTYNITSNFDYSQHDAIWKMTAKYGTPYFANFVNSSMQPSDVRSMCCRLRLDNTVLQKRLGGIFASAPLTGSIGVVTVNLPQIALRANNEVEFFDMLDNLMELAKDSLEIKREYVEHLTERGLYPYSKVYLESVKAKTGKYWGNHFSTIGINGAHECCLNMFGYGIDDEYGKLFIESVLNHVRGRLLQFQNETGNLYNLEASPAESANYRFARYDTAHFKHAHTSGAEHPYYTNSSQAPVSYGLDLYDVLDHQDKLQILYTGGTVQHVFLGERIDDWQQVPVLIKSICENYRLPYFTISPVFSVCKNGCGYLAGRQETCPTCGGGTIIYDRVVGYLQPVSNWNDGKQAEELERVRFQPWGETI